MPFDILELLAETLNCTQNLVVRLTDEHTPVHICCQPRSRDVAALFAGLGL